ncbi:hypothetical protein [Streptantibioticus ferralitis]|uniref:Uncharacterized protein n=1 Tax=Streptantibioticus ferralitis TaxID=236510 RepID=A0ABT5Z3S6_9ACTN|nr:hypothetical protein [Streptantibioticus ferralitis]MDF2258354.1 hypothetical protein [Streptantibioticus ferralitis]
MSSALAIDHPFEPTRYRRARHRTPARAGRGGIALSIGKGPADRQLRIGDTFDLYHAAEELYAAIQATVDPIAILDVLGGYRIAN